MSEELFYSGLSPAGTQSPRSYTRPEIAAARRRGLISGKESQELSGALFWATGDYYPAMVRQAAKDYALLAKAIEREWGKEWK